jgi:maltose/maltodextrin transport system permease protein
VSLPTVSPIRLLIAALAVLPVLYLDFLTYRSGNSWLGVVILGVIALGLYIYLNPRAYTFRYLFPGLFAFALFVIFPLLYTVYISFTKYSSSHLLPYQSVVELLEQDSYIVPDTPIYDYLLYRQGGGKYVLLLTDQSNREQRFLSEPFDLQPGQTVHYPMVVNASAVEPNRSIDGEPLKIGQITREGLFIPLR